MRHLHCNENAISNFLLGMSGEEQKLLPELRALGKWPGRVVQVEASTHYAACHLQQRQGRLRLCGKQLQQQLRKLRVGKQLLEGGLRLLHVEA